MTFNLFALRLSDKRKIADQLKRGEKDEFVSSLKPFLSQNVDTGSADEAYVYATAVELTAIGVWDHLEPKELARAMSGTVPNAASAFLRGLPSAIARHVDAELRQKAVQGKVARIGGALQIQKITPRAQRAFDDAIARKVAAGRAAQTSKNFENIPLFRTATGQVVGASALNGRVFSAKKKKNLKSPAAKKI